MMSNRVGTFLILVGLFLVGLFAYSDMVKTPMCNLLIFGGVALGVGISLWFRSPAPPGQPNSRFRILKGAGKKQEKKK
jgi:hypothetical protein